MPCQYTEGNAAVPKPLLKNGTAVSVVRYSGTTQTTVSATVWSYSHTNDEYFGAYLIKLDNTDESLWIRASSVLASVPQSSVAVSKRSGLPQSIRLIVFGLMNSSADSEVDSAAQHENETGNGDIITKDIGSADLSHKLEQFLFKHVDRIYLKEGELIKNKKLFFHSGVLKGLRHNVHGIAS